MLAQATAPGLEYGALGLVALVVLYVTYALVKWMTNTLNGKLDRIATGLEAMAKATDANTSATKDVANAVGSNTAATREQAGATRELTRRVESIDGRLPR